MKQKLKMMLTTMAVFGTMFCHVLSAATVLSGTELTIDGTDYEVTETLTLSKVTFKTGNKVFGSGSLSLSANAVIAVDSNVEGATIDIPVVCTGRVTMNVDTGAELDFNADVDMREYLFGTVRGTLKFNSTMHVLFNFENMAASAGSFFINGKARSSTWRLFAFRVANNYLGTEDALTGDDMMHGVRFSANCALDCCGHDQHFSSIQDRNGYGANCAVRSTGGATTIYLTGTNPYTPNLYATTFSGTFEDDISLVFYGNKITNTLNGVSTSTGGLVASNNTTVVINGGWAGSNVVVAAGSRIRASNVDSFNKNTVLTALPTDGVKGVFEVDAGLVVSVHSLNLGGTVYDAIGSYGSSESSATYKLPDWFAGEGVVYVTRGMDLGGHATWIGAGDNTAVSTVGNWDGDVDYQSGYSSATFATGGTEAGVDTAMSFAGVTLATPSSIPTFTFAQLGGGSLSLGKSGIVVSNHEDVVARSFVFNVPVAFGTAAIDVLNDADSITFNNGLSGVSDAVITKAGPGSLYLNGMTSVPEGLVISNGTCYPGDGSNAVGVAGSKLVVNQTTGGYLQMSNALNTAASMTLTGPDRSTGNSLSPVRIAENTTNEISGAVDMAGAGFCVPATSVLKLSGGVAVARQGAGGSETFFDDGGMYVIREKPLDCTATALHVVSSILQLSVADNKIGGYFYIHSTKPRDDGNVVLTVPYALNFPSSVFIMGTSVSDGGTLNLGGHDQGVTRILTGYRINGERVKPIKPCYVTSATPAVLYHRCSNNDTLFMDFRGAAGYKLVGTGTVTLCTVSDTTGSLGVTNGTLVVGAEAAWPNVSEVVVSGAGTLRLSGASQLNSKMALSLSDSGNIDIPDGVTVRCKKLYIDGRECSGVWGAPGSGAPNTDARLIGNGYIRGGGGFILTFY